MLVSKPRWIFVDTAVEFGGHEVMLLRWLQEVVAQRNVTPILIARDKTRLTENVPKGVLTRLLPAVATTTRFGVISSAVNRLKDMYYVIQHVLSVKPEVAVVAEGCLLSQGWVTLLLRMLNVVTVVYVPLVDSGVAMGFAKGKQRDWLLRHFYRHLPHAWITLTPDQANSFTKWAHINKPVLCLRNTVVTHIEHAYSYRSSVSRPLQVLLLGRLDAPQKGLDMLLDYLLSKPALRERLHFTLVGDGPFRATLENALHMHTELSQMLSVQAWSPAITALQTHDVLLIVSRFEGVPLVMLEAMALGIPVIASNLPGTRAYLPTRCLFPVGDMEMATRALLNLSDDQLRHNIVTGNRKVFEANASGRAFAVSVQQLTQDLLTLSRTTIMSPTELPES